MDLPCGVKLLLLAGLLAIAISIRWDVSRSPIKYVANYPYLPSYLRSEYVVKHLLEWNTFFDFERNYLFLGSIEILKYGSLLSPS